MNESKTALLSTVSQATAILVVTVYAAGFLIVNLHLAHWGVSQVNLLRPHILSAGTLFLLLCAIPAFVALSTFGLIRPRLASAPAFPWKPVNHRGWLNLQTMAFLALPIYFIATISGSALLPWRPFGFADSRGWNFFLLFAALEAVISVVSRSLFDRLRFLLVPLSLVHFAAFVFVMNRYSDKGVSELFWWYYSVGIVGFLAIVEFGRWRHGGTELQLALAPIYLLALVTAYSQGIYAEIRPELGGGAPTPVVLYLSGKAPFSASSDPTHAMLLDESDTGYFVLIPDEPKATAYFIRRDLVAAVKFEASSKEPESESAPRKADAQSQK